MKLSTTGSRGLPRFRIGEVWKARDSIQGVFASLADQPLDAEEFGDLYKRLKAAIPTKRDLPALKSALSMLTVMKADPVYLRFFAARIAGNLRTFRRGGQVSFQQGQAARSWCYGIVREVDRAYFGRRGPRNVVLVECIAGPWAGEEVEGLASEGMLWFIASHTGCSRVDKTLRFRASNELVGFKMMVCAQSADRPEWRPRIDEFYATPIMIKENRLLLRGRIAPCPQDKDAPCYECDYGQDQCEFAIRQFTLVIKECPNCRVITTMDPRHPEACSKCRWTNLEARKRKRKGDE